MDKSEEFAKSGKKLISEYDADAYFEEKEERKPFEPKTGNIDINIEPELG